MTRTRPRHTLPPAPQHLSSPPAAVVHAPISEPKEAAVECAGSSYPSYLRCRQNNTSAAEDYEQHVLPQQLAQAKLDDEAEPSSRLELDKVTSEMLRLDPADWKSQDHYRVMGISGLRYKATQAQIKQAHRLRALEFHPDKRAASGATGDDVFFKCVQRAYEVLSDPVRRRQFDSVDPAISDDIPPPHLDGTDSDFFALYRPVFEREGRFSKKQPVPQLGDMDTPRDQVEGFYAFWSSLDSWRTFEYLDKEHDKGDNREEKRWFDKKNKSERIRRKTEDNKRVSRLVQQAIGLDPRIGIFKKNDRQEKERRRMEKSAAASNALETKRQEEAAMQRLEARQAERESQVADDERRRREQIRQEFRMMKRSIRSAAKQHTYMLEANNSTHVVVARRAAEIDILLENISHDSAVRLEQALTSGTGSRTEMETAVADAIAEAIGRIPIVAPSFTSFIRGVDVAAHDRSERDAKNAEDAHAAALLQREWTPKELELLIKATNKFPGGTANRWETVGAWLAQHSGLSQRSETELVTKTMELRRGANSRSESVVKVLQNKKLNDDDKRINSQVSVRYDEGPVAANRPQPTPAPSPAAPERQWSTAEQTQLERALQAYPPSYKGTDRWDKIAQGVAGRSKKECMLRVSRKCRSSSVRRNSIDVADAAGGDDADGNSQTTQTTQTRPDQTELD
ncbi:hypothetical protein GGI07_003777 [Coemansia sp. Benny D115]|nr:hypothetical protein GGI07_003777 [Coemansia sp. Benny D115]